VKRGVPSEALPWVTRLRAEKLKQFIGEQNVVVEFGVGAGWNLRSLECSRKIGVDVADFLAADLAQAGIEFHASLDTVPDGVADTVICHHALEHVIDPAATLRALQRVAKPGGRMLLHVPYESERRYRQFDPSEPNHHLFSWNAQTLAALATECGWKVESAGIGEFGYDRWAAVQALRFKLGEGGYRLVRRLAHLLKPGREVRVVARLGN
jgi:SAM-dependent methyltransferase